MKRKGIILAVSNNLSQRGEMNEWKGREADDHQSLARWMACFKQTSRFLRSTSLYLYKLDYPGFLVVENNTPSILLFISPRGCNPPCRTGSMVE